MSRRLLKEVQALARDPTPDGITLVHDDSDSDNQSDGDKLNLGEVRIAISVPANQIYADSLAKPYILRFVFSEAQDYPFSPPQVLFATSNVPLHPHIYSNGHICLDVLYDEWTPVQTILSVALSVQSMLSSNTKLERPVDDQEHCRHAPANPQKSRWVFHDNTV